MPLDAVCDPDTSTPSPQCVISEAPVPSAYTLKVQGRSNQLAKVRSPAHMEGLTFSRTGHSLLHSL